jgi:hypothetical protein
LVGLGYHTLGLDALSLSRAHGPGFWTQRFGCPCGRSLCLAFSHCFRFQSVGFSCSRVLSGCRRVLTEAVCQVGGFVVVIALCSVHAIRCGVCRHCSSFWSFHVRVRLKRTRFAVLCSRYGVDWAYGDSVRHFAMLMSRSCIYSASIMVRP